MTTRLTLAYSAPTDEATKAWEKARPKGDSNPPLSPAFRALCETAEVARGGVDALIEALQEALEAKYEKETIEEERDYLKAELEDVADERQDFDRLEESRDALQRELEELKSAMRGLVK
jgi:hypothetical protein